MLRVVHDAFGTAWTTPADALERTGLVRSTYYKYRKNAIGRGFLEARGDSSTSEEIRLTAAGVGVVHGDHEVTTVASVDAGSVDHVHAPI